MRLGVYTQASTANPTGRRPWNSRLSYYVPNSFNPPTAGQGPWLLQPGVTGMPMQAGGVPTPGLGFYKRAKFYVPTFTMSGLGQFFAPSGTRASFRRTAAAVPAVGALPTQQPTAPYIIRSTGAQPPRAIWATPAVPAQPVGFQPVGTSPSGAPIYASAPGLAPQAAGQGYYQIGVDAQGNPIYSTNPTAAQLASAQQQAALTAAQQAAAATAAAPAASTAAPASTSSISDWLSTDSLGFGLSNGWYLGIGGAAVFLFMSKKR